MASGSSATLKDVAQRAGVSVMTVSAVLNGKSVERRISPATQARVQEIARLLSYQPNAVARSLRRQSTNIIGLYSGLGYLNAHNHFLAELIGGLQIGCDEHQKDLLLHGTFRGRSSDDIYAELHDGRLDGLIVQALPSDPLVDRLAASHLPVIAAVDAIPSIPSVVTDDAGGLRLLIQHLAERGYRRLLYLGPTRRIVSELRRQAAFWEASERLGLEVCEEQIPPGRDFAGSPVEAWLRAGAGKRPGAVVCWMDGMAYAFMAYCRREDLRIPEDVAVTGFDGFVIPGAVSRQLTTIRAPWGEVARVAVTLLVEQLTGRQIASETVLPVELIVGDTT